MPARSSRTTRPRTRRATSAQVSDFDTPQYGSPSGFNMTKVLFPVLVVLLVASAFLIGVLWTKISYMQKGVTFTQAANPSVAGGALTAGQVPSGTTGQQVAGADIAKTPATTSVTLDTIKGLWDRDLVRFGDKNRKLLFVEVGDPSCPYCHVAGGEDPEISAQIGDRFKYASSGGAYVPPVTEMKKLVEQGKASFVYIYTPGHGNGEMGMKAMYCGAEQGKFWPVHDLMMSKAGYDLQNTQVQNDKTKSQQVVDFVRGVVDSNKLKACLDSGKYDARLSSDTQIAATLGVQGTPGFFVNATPFKGAYSWTDMKSVADNALK